MELMKMYNDEPISDDKPTIKSSIQELRKLLMDTREELLTFSAIVNGDRRADEPMKDVSNLWEESRLVTALAYENLQLLREIKGSVI